MRWDWSGSWKIAIQPFPVLQRIKFYRQGWRSKWEMNSPFHTDSNKLILGNFWLVKILYTILQVDINLIVSWINNWRLPFMATTCSGNPKRVVKWCGLMFVEQENMGYMLIESSQKWQFNMLAKKNGYKHSECWEK